MIPGIVASQVVDIGPPPDLAPVITSGNSVSVAENVTLAHALTANESVTWSLVGGADQARFEISGSTLRWLSNGTKNFEAPDDADTNNTYIVTVRATDTALQTTDQTITATVTDADEVAPTLSSATGTATSDTEADLSVSTNEGNGTLYWVVTQSATGPTKAQVKLGQNHAGAAADDFGNQAVSGTGVQNITGGATGLTAETEYWAHFMHEDAATNQSDVATSASFETDAAAPLTAVGPFTLGSLTSGWNGWTIVARIPSSAISNTGHAQTRVTFRGAPSGAENAQVSMAYIGMMAAAGDGFDFATTPVQLLVGGIGTFTVPQGADLVTDFVTFEIVAGEDLLIAASFNNASHDNFGFESQGGFFNYSRNIAGDAATVDKSSYSTAANQLAFVKQVEVIG